MVTLRNLRDSFKLYKSKVNPVVNIKDYLSINGDYNKFLMDKILNGKEVTLPSRLGTLGIVGREQKLSLDEKGNVKGLAPDWVKTKELWDKNPEAKAAKKRIYHMNTHTDNVRYKFVWTKRGVLVVNKTLYSLRITRGNKREVHSRIIEGKKYITK